MNLAALASRVEKHETRLDKLERLVQILVEKSIQLHQEMQEFKEEMRAFKEEMRAWRERSEKEMTQFRKQWGELANRLGTLAEDIVAPGLPYAIKKYFNLPVEKVFARVDVQKNGKAREYDVIAIAGDKIFVVDVKSQYRSEYFKRFKKMLEEFFDWFPEYKGKKIIPVIASFNLSPGVIKQATKRKCLALQMGGEYLEFVNFKDLQKIF